MRGASILLASLAALASPAAAGEVWLLAVDRWGNQENHVLTVEDERMLGGDLDGWPMAGQRQGQVLHFVATDRFGIPYHFDGTIDGERIAGTADFPDTGNRGPRVVHAFTGRRLRIPLGPPMRHRFVPERYSNTFTAALDPVLVIRPGDRVATRTVDSGGIDENGRVVALYGNPQTGPFFVVGAQAGDVLAVQFHCLRLNRDHADSLDGLARRATPLELAGEVAGLGEDVRWRLDRRAGTARLQDPPARLSGYVVPVRPMLGGVGVAPEFGLPAQSAGDSGRWGGNLDFNEVVEGSTVYLPVFQPGAMLFLGDGHALQGDGETTQWALETSLDVEFSVRLLAPRPLAAPRVATADRISVLGQASSLDEAARAATAAMIQWLQQDYGLSTREATLVLGTVAEYRVVTLAGRNAGLALSLPRTALAQLPTQPDAMAGGHDRDGSPSSCASRPAGSGERL